MKLISSLGCAGFFLFLLSCTQSSEIDTSSIPTDTAIIKLGRAKFREQCSSCHNFNVDEIGPQLGGFTKLFPTDWIRDFIKNPKALIDSGDPRAKEQFDKFKLLMPPFGHLSDDDMNAILAYIHTTKVPNLRKATMDPNALRNPIPESIQMSDLVIELKPWIKIPQSADEPPYTRITKINHQPKTDKYFVVDIRGKLYYLNGDKPEVYLDMAKERPNFMNVPGHGTGFGGFTFHPEFAKNGLLYTSHSEFPKSKKADHDYADSIKTTLQWVVTEWKTKTPGAIPFVGESRELLRIELLGQLHGIQEITFNPFAKPGTGDYGLLYICVGDGGNSERGYPQLCGSTEKIWGTVLRIDPKGNNSPNGNYGIPDSNPFVKSDNPNTVKEIFAYGFRNPHRIMWDATGRIFVANIGHHNVEALYIIEGRSNCGWPSREGGFVIDPTQNMHNIYPLPADDSKNNFTYPVAQYDHDEGNAISGGYDYMGTKVPELKGKYLFGEIVKGRIFFIEMQEVKSGSLAPIQELQISVDGKITTLSELCGADKVDVRVHRDRNGELLITTKPDGMIYKVAGAYLQTE